LLQLTNKDEVAKIEGECKRRSIRLGGIWLNRGGKLPPNLPRWMHTIDNTASRASHNLVMEARELLAPEIGWHARP
jgi:hypothetical protein